MPPPFQELTRNDFAKLLKRFPFERRIDGVHLHHSWRPSASEYRGHATLLLMWQTDCWRVGRSDISQHLSIGPRGEIWTGRDWNRAPCSAPGHNGNAKQGPFMISLIGNFNENGDTISEAQRDSVAEAIARVQACFDLAPTSLSFHRDFCHDLQCPGTTLVLAELVEKVQTARARLVSAAPPPVPPSDRFRPFGGEAESWYQFITICNARRGQFAAERTNGNGAEADGR
jgi:hypothetical protein